MRRKRLFCAALALLLALTCAVPACADEPDAESALPLEADVVETEQPEPTETPEEVPVETPEEAPVEAPEEVPEETPEGVPEEIPEEVPEETPEEVPEETPEEVPEEIPEEVPEKVPEAPEADGAETVDVTVPAAGSVIINPYGLPVETAAGTSAEQIVSEEMPIVNNGETPVTVWVSAAGSVAGLSSAEFVSDPAQLDTGVKGIFMYAEFKPEGEDWRGGYADELSQVLIAERASEPQEVLTLDEGASGLFRLFGATSVAPDDPWGSEDEIHVTFTFTFKTPEGASDSQDAEEEEELPAEEEPADGEPPIEEEPATGDEPAAEEEPATGEEPAAEEEPATGDEPSAEEESPAEEEPPTEKEPAEVPEVPAGEIIIDQPEVPATEEPVAVEAPAESAQAPVEPEPPDGSDGVENISI